MPNQPTIKPSYEDSWKLMLKIRESLGKSGLTAVFQKSATQIGRYCQGMACQDRQKNPLDRMRKLIESLQAKGGNELAKEVVNFLAEPLACRLQPVSYSRPDKDTITEECLDDYPEKTRLDELILNNAHPNQVVRQAENCKREIDETVTLFIQRSGKQILAYKKSG